MNTLSQIGIAMFALFVAFSMTSQCNRAKDSGAAEIEQQADVILREKAKGLDLAAVTALAKKAKDAADFERLLNSQSEGVNNIDLNDDQTVDYINVTEYGSGERRGFSLSTEISPGNVQELATIDFQKEAEKVTTQTTGNSSLYGAGNYYHSSFGVTDALLLAWLFSDRGSYSSPYGYGNYPPTYGRGWNRMPDGSYTGQMSSRTAGSSINKSSKSVIDQPALSPNAQKTAAKAQALTTATQSQRSFAKTSSSKPTSSGGFGRSSTSSSSRSGGFGGGGK